jgi:hypothetical protein
VTDAVNEAEFGVIELAAVVVTMGAAAEVVKDASLP